MRSFQQPNSRHQQRGAILIAALVLLMTITIIGVTAMQTATLEEKMATNSMIRNVVLQGADSGWPGVLDDRNFAVRVLQSTTLPVAAADINMYQTDSTTYDKHVRNLSVSAVATFVTDGNAPGWSWSVDGSGNSSYYFVVDADAEYPDRNVSVGLERGSFFIGPAGAAD